MCLSSTSAKAQVNLPNWIGKNIQEKVADLDKWGNKEQTYVKKLFEKGLKM